MPTVSCPHLEEVEITFPDTWLVRHHEAFWQAYRDAGGDQPVTHTTALLFGCAAVCDKIDGLPRNGSGEVDIGEWPMEVYDWLIETIYTGGLKKTRSSQTELLSMLPTMRKET